MTEWFYPENQPADISSYWDAPERVDDLQLISRPGETPALAFTSRDSSAEYLILRKAAGESEVAAVLSADAGNLIIWADPDADLRTSQSYSVLPRHRLLYETGTLLTGTESANVEYNPGSLFSRLFR